MKIYVAASYPRKQEAWALAETLKAAGHTIISTWLHRDEGYTSDDRTSETGKQKCRRMQEAATRDLEEVKACQVFVCITDGETQLTYGGRHTELGIALALDRLIIIVGPMESVFHYSLSVVKIVNYHDFEIVKDTICEYLKRQRS